MNFPDALWREHATEEEVLAAMQEAVDTGTAWHLQGSVGRACAGAIDAGLIMLGPHYTTTAITAVKRHRKVHRPGNVR